MEKAIIQLITAFLGSLGFAMLFNLRAKLLLPAAMGGFLSWGAYLLCTHFMEGIFIPMLITAAFSAMYAEILARLLKAPATLFLVPAAIPLVPGSSLFYTMSYAVQNDWDMVHKHGNDTVIFALGIAIGISIVWAFFVMAGNISAEIRTRRGTRSDGR